MKWNHILLAGGRSSRMGTPKPLLESPAGENFVKAKIKRARQSGALCSFLVTGFHEDRIRSGLDPLPDYLRIVRNPAPEADQTSSMKVALSSAGCEFPAVMDIVDQPPLRVETLQKIVPDETDSDLIRIPSYVSRRGHPPWFPAWFLREIDRMASDRGINSLYEKFPDKIKFIEVEDEFVIQDLDSPCEYQNYYFAEKQGDLNSN